MLAIIMKALTYTKQKNYRMKATKKEWFQRSWSKRFTFKNVLKITIIIELTSSFNFEEKVVNTHQYKLRRNQIDLNTRNTIIILKYL